MTDRSGLPDELAGVTPASSLSAARCTRIAGVMRDVADDCERDAATVDQTPFTAAGVGSTFGNLLAMVRACALGLAAVADELARTAAADRMTPPAAVPGVDPSGRYVVSLEAGTAEILGVYVGIRDDSIRYTAPNGYLRSVKASRAAVVSGVVAASYLSERSHP